MDEVDGIAGRMTNSNDTRSWMIRDTADRICLLSVRETELLDRFAQAKVPKLKGMILLHTDNDISKGNSFCVRAKLVHEKDRGWPRLLS